MSDAPLATERSARHCRVPSQRRAAGSDFAVRLRANSEYVVIPLVGARRSRRRLFSVFLLAIGKSPVDFVSYVWRGGFGTCVFGAEHAAALGAADPDRARVAIPARIGLIMIGGEGALVLGGFAAAVLAIPMIGHVPPMPTLIVMALSAMIVGGFWVGLVGLLRYAAASTRRSRRCF